MVWYGMVWYYGMYGMYGMVWYYYFFEFITIRYGMVWYGMVCNWV